MLQDSHPRWRKFLTFLKIHFSWINMHCPFLEHSSIKETRLSWSASSVHSFVLDERKESKLHSYRQKIWEKFLPLPNSSSQLLFYRLIKATNVRWALVPQMCTRDLPLYWLIDTGLSFALNIPLHHLLGGLRVLCAWRLWPRRDPQF